MKAEEIRIGNWFNHNLEWSYSENTGYFQWSDRDWYAVGECTLFLENVSPIALTEEWLWKFGFEKIDSTTPEIHPWADYIKNDVVISMPYFEFYYGYRDSPVVIKSVHQLMNLYYTLTGEELEVKL